jgi:prepilin-type processing-associated H-X9-DG protein
MIAETNGLDSWNCYGLCYNAAWKFRINHGNRLNGAYLDGHVEAVEGSKVTFVEDDYYYIHTINHTKTPVHIQ